MKNLSGLSDQTRIVLDSNLTGHALLAVHTKCMEPAKDMRRGIVSDARQLCRKCFGDVVKSHRRWSLRRLLF